MRCVLQGYWFHSNQISNLEPTSYYGYALPHDLDTAAIFSGGHCRGDESAAAEGDSGCLSENQDCHERCWNTFQMPNKPMHNPLGRTRRTEYSGTTAA